MKLTTLLFLTVLSSLPTIGYTSPDLSNKPYFNTIELINRIQKYDDTKFIRYREEKINDYKSSYYFYDDDPDYFVRNERGIIRIGYPFVLRREMVNNPALFNYISDKEKEEAITIIAIGIDDKEKAREIFNRLHTEYLKEYEDKKDCLNCFVESNVIHNNINIIMHGEVNKKYGRNYAVIKAIYFPPLKSTPEDLKKYYGTF
ncbi:hypothetical protein [Moraxella equi]|uniref:Uncharacterized protein n=1 Tax=Moraxella equi TaxID=60442 RepID=A0A378QVN2_9GAMM|nr:hypothetical protein [Moraxella equi]OPH35673.1 hypothetical protein B5J93_10370 [Moraxella equi]STZ04440.1 Uncharacterised protein [Moraxella equi]